MKKIGIIGAMELEVETPSSHDHHQDHYQSPHGISRRHIKRYSRCHRPQRCRQSQCRSLCTDPGRPFQVTAIINTGVAGSLNAALDIGDILISKDALHHDVDATIFGYKPGEVPSWDAGNSLQMSILSRLLPAPVREVNPDIHVHTGRVVSGRSVHFQQRSQDRLIKEFQGTVPRWRGLPLPTVLT